jgi:hypothetical protein
VSAVSQFNCGEQNRSLPEGLRQYKVIPQLLAVHGAARPSGFYISSGNVNNVLGVQPSTGQLYVLNSSALDYESSNNYTLIVSGRQRSFDSGWVHCTGVDGVCGVGGAGRVGWGLQVAPLSILFLAPVIVLSPPPPHPPPSCFKPSPVRSLFPRPCCLPGGSRWGPKTAPCPTRRSTTTCT